MPKKCDIKNLAIIFEDLENNDDSTSDVSEDDLRDFGFNQQEINMILEKEEE